MDYKSFDNKKIFSEKKYNNYCRVILLHIWHMQVCMHVCLYMSCMEILHLLNSHYVTVAQVRCILIEGNKNDVR